jgi:ABC-type glycerol-3-phosphate transport system substrate-binding protein
MSEVNHDSPNGNQAGFNGASSGKSLSRRHFLMQLGLAAIAIPAGGVLLEACGSSSTTSSAAGKTSSVNDEPTAATTVELWDSMPLPTEQYWKTVLYPEFRKANPRVSISERDYGTENGSVIAAGLAAGGKNSPNMVWDASEDTGLYKASGKVLDIGPWLDANPTIKSDIIPSLLSLSTYDGQILSLPWMSNCTAMLLNVDAFHSHGVPIPSQDPETTWTWAEFADACAKLTDSEMKGFTLTTGDGTWDAWLFTAWAAAAGGYLVSPSGEIGFNNAPTLRAVEFLADLGRKGQVVLTDSTAALTPWFTQKAAITCNGPWNFPDLQTFKTFKFTVVPFPRDVQPATNLGGDQLFIFTNGDANVQAGALAYAKYMLSTPFQVAFNIESGNLPVTTSATNAKAYQDHLANYPYLKGWINSIPYGVARTPLPNITQIFNVWDAAWTDIILKQAVVAQSMQSASARAKLLAATA